jgi:hypothetical protein
MFFARPRLAWERRRGRGVTGVGLRFSGSSGHIAYQRRQLQGTDRSFVNTIRSQRAIRVQNLLTASGEKRTVFP